MTSWLRLRAPAAAVGLLLGACFRGDFLAGTPCTDDFECGPGHRCIDRRCDGVVTDNLAPIARDDRYEALMDIALVVGADDPDALLANDEDLDGDTLALRPGEVASRRGGAVTFDGGAFSYEPPPDFWGCDEFTYHLDDSREATASAQVRLAVRPTEARLGRAVAVGSGHRLADDALRGLGSAVAGLGDIDGDGFADFAVSDPNFDIANFVYGAVYLVYGAGNLVSDTIDNYAAAKKARRITAAAQSAQFGQTLAPAGDFNKDGRQDLLIGQPAWNKLRGRAFVVYLPATRPEPFSLPDVPDKAVGAVVTSNTFTGGTNLGASLAAAGDFDGDGTSDVVLGGAGPTFNRALVVRGGPDVGGMIEASQLVSKGTGFSIQGAQGDLLGSAVAGGLDLNGDGRGDLLLGTGVGFGGTGGAYVAFGRDTPATLLASDLAVGNGGFALAGEQANGEAGASVALVPSMNGDALADLLIGAPHYTSNLANAGRAYLVYGGDCHP